MNVFPSRHSQNDSLVHSYESNKFMKSSNNNTKGTARQTFTHNIELEQSKEFKSMVKKQENIVTQTLNELRK
jgi:hypothetical protein